MWMVQRLQNAAQGVQHAVRRLHAAGKQRNLCCLFQETARTGPAAGIAIDEKGWEGMAARVLRDQGRAIRAHRLADRGRSCWPSTWAKSLRSCGHTAAPNERPGREADRGNHRDRPVGDRPGPVHSLRRREVAGHFIDTVTFGTAHSSIRVDPDPPSQHSGHLFRCLAATSPPRRLPSPASAACVPGARSRAADDHT